jgi:nucleoside-diphosphate-sugar epimerase
MKVLVTGGAGFVGAHTSEYYAKRGDDVVVFDNLSRGETLKSANKSIDSINYNWNQLKKYENIELVRGDIRKAQDIAKASMSSRRPETQGMTQPSFTAQPTRYTAKT